MPTYSERRQTDLSAEQVFDLVADVEHYPDFLPSWQQAVVRSRAIDAYDTEQTVGFGLMAHRFSTHTVLDRPRRILVTSSDAVFSRFTILWEFTPSGEHGCRIDLSLDFVVRSWVLAPAVEMLLAPTAAAMVAAFERRAHDLAACPTAAAVH